MRLLCVDVGNTSTTLGLYEDGAVSRVSRVAGGVLVNPEACADLARLVSLGGVEGVSIASVVPKSNAKWRALIEEALGCKPRFVTHESPLGFALDYPNRTVWPTPRAGWRVTARRSSWWTSARR